MSSGESPQTQYCFAQEVAGCFGVMPNFFCSSSLSDAAVLDEALSGLETNQEGDMAERDAGR